VTLKNSARDANAISAHGMSITSAIAPLNQLQIVATDEALVLLGRNKTPEKPFNIPEFLTIHCIILCILLVAKYFKFENIMKIFP
jgi:hypothetical protein